MTHEGMLEKTRKETKKADKITEGTLADAKSDLYPHRQYKDGGDKFDVTPINLMSEAYDQKWRDAFSKANKGADTSFWDKYLHADLDDKPTKISNNVPKSGSQLSDNPTRFKNLQKLPTDENASVNRDNFDKNIKVDRLHVAKNEKMQKIAYKNLAIADKCLFAIYAQAKSENRDLNQQEKEVVNEINVFKENVLLRLADSMFNDGYRGDKDLQKELFKNDPFAADSQMKDSIDFDDNGVIDDIADLDDINLTEGNEEIEDDENNLIDITDEDEYENIKKITDETDGDTKNIPF
jgi:hypothetical protein